ncbi:MAG: caspase family protein [Treponema sp.]|nr:caspase family protein [Treponema sp.]
MKKAVLFIFILLIGVVLFAQQKHALVIGNANYTGIPSLNNPVNDANDMKVTLEEMGFTVNIVLNGSRQEMETAVLNLKRNLSNNRNTYGLFFYAGHGVQSNGENYLIPVNAEIPSENALRDRAVSLQWILSELNEARNELNLVVLDSCRDNPFSWNRSAVRGLTVVTHAPPGSVIFYATADGRPAQDGTGRNGLFTGQLLNNLKTPGLELTEVIRRTGAAVTQVSGGRQIPAVNIQFFGTAYLGTRPSPSPNPSPDPSPIPIISPQEKFEKDIETIRAAGPGNYTVTLIGDIVFSTSFNFTGMQNKIITIQGDSSMRTITNMSISNHETLFNIPHNCVIILSNNITLDGNNKKSVYIYGGRFEMQNGIIINSSSSGVGIHEGTFLMNGGTIRNCWGGVSVSGIFTMNNGVISNNSSAGGVSLSSSGSFTMNNGTISGNSSSSGGGVSVYGTFTMNGGTINNNTAVLSSFGMGGDGGGVAIRSGGTFFMRGGFISGNRAVESGGGICAYRGGAFIKTSGTISYTNRAKNGNVWWSPVFGNSRSRTAGPSDNVTLRP